MEKELLTTTQVSVRFSINRSIIWKATKTGRLRPAKKIITEGLERKLRYLYHVDDVEEFDRTRIKTVIKKTASPDRITTIQAAHLSGMSPGIILNHIRKKDGLHAEKCGNRFEIDLKVFKKYIKKAFKVGALEIHACPAALPKRFIDCMDYGKCLDAAARRNTVFGCTKCPQYNKNNKSNSEWGENLS